MAIQPHSSHNIKGLDDFIAHLKDFNHEKLKNLLGGDANGHFHLTQNELSKLINIPDNLDSINHEQLMGLLGGNSSGHYHITAAMLDKINNLPNSITQNHEGLSGLLGGNSSGHYHLSLDEVNKLDDYPVFNQLNHEQLQGLLGGNASGHYHLTDDLLDKLINMPDDGAPGSDGLAATIQIGTVTTGEAGSDASVTNSGTSTNAIFDFVIPRGDKGDKGDKGEGSSVDIINNLTSNRTDAALSAYQGKVLNDKINNKMDSSTISFESWTFTLDDGNTITKSVGVAS